MLPVLSSLRGLLKIQSTSIDSNVDRLHYKVTVIVLLAFSILITSGQFFGEPMDCDFPDYRYHSLNTYCYIHSTFLGKQALNDRGDERVPTHLGSPGFTAEDQKNYYGYYEWVFIVLFLQAVSYYIPRFIWKSWEGGRIQMLAGGLADPVLSKDCIRENTKPLVDYFSMRLHSHNAYAAKYFIYETLYLANTVIQIFGMNRFFGEDFQYYGLNVAFHQQFGGNMVNPMEKVFPTITQCIYERYGPSGTMESRDGICVMAQNSVNSKIYVFLWFWFHILALLSALQIIYRIVLALAPPLRLWCFRSSSALNNAQEVDAVFRKLWIGDWFLLHMLQQNMNPLAYKELISQIAEHDDDTGEKNVFTMSPLYSEHV
ncbi:innexin Vnx-c16 [Ichnoviriform fugitivi]|uniref:Innexin Vnx-c16 n=1 Tax=Ichnoviriform fugitivi TaxID=265522 RepID=Q6QDA3_9VIRU|nr:innexin Vnx-c16 [Ichnoviriform fugitivi]AAS58041.1 innexin Vnx-c16 [Ichnoviriform fugitivi]